MPTNDRIQLQVGLTFKEQPADHPRVKPYLDRGYRVVDLQRVNDREALVTLAPPATN